jgi:serine/threonine protein kinase
VSTNALSLVRDEFTGKQYGKYELVCRLSQGGMASLFLASAKGAAGFQKLVVLKKILPDMADNPDFIRRFLEEARVMAGFNHPNIAQVYDLDEHGGEYFLAMEFVTGASLLEVVNGYIAHQEAMPLGLGLAAARDTALALHYAHTYVDPLGRPRRVVHRDVAPKNVMMTYDGATKLLDFGVAKSQGSGQTQVGMVIGTPGYMSPEQVLAQELDGRSDVFSLAVTTFECLTAHRLFGRQTAEKEMRAPLVVDPPVPSTLNPRIPAGIDEVLLRALSKRREERHASALELSKALDAAGGALMWPPDKRGEAIQRLFAHRREQTRRLLQALEEAPDTSRINFQRLDTEPSMPSFASELPDTRPGRLRPVGAQDAAVNPAEALTQRVGRAARKGLWALVPLIAVGGVVLLAKLLPATENAAVFSPPALARAPAACPDGGTDAASPP